jgi:hypothetical protein
VIPERLVDALPTAIARVAERERTLLGALGAPGVDAEKLKNAWKVFEVK